MRHLIAPVCLSILLFFAKSFAQELEEFKIKRKEVFEFTQNPKIEKMGDSFAISFTVKDYCDATIVIENSQNKIRRHLISGVLGKNPPKPFTADSLSQKVIWDGKDDEGKYIDDIENCHVRVSLGLKPVFEKKLFSTPYKRMGNNAPIICADKSGIYTYEGMGSEFIKHFDHKGDYIKTVYPFPANKIKDVKGLEHTKSLMDGKSYPKKLGYNQATFLTSGSSSGGDCNNHMGGYAASAMAVKNGHLAIAFEGLNRLGTDGSSNGLDFVGPKVSFKVRIRDHDRSIGPTSIAFSPDNKYLYLTGYILKTDFWEFSGDCYHVVYRMEYAKNEAPTVFMGKVETDKGIGDDNKSFCVPTSVDVDDKGRVYVSDFGNHRIQVFQEDGTFLKSIPTNYPSRVIINPKTQEIIVFSMKVIGPSSSVIANKKMDLGKLPATMRNMGTFENPKEGAIEELPIKGGTGAGGWSDNGGQIYQVAINPYSEKESLWAVGRKPTLSTAEFRWSGEGYGSLVGWAASGVRGYNKNNGKWEEFADFGKKALSAVKRVDPPPLGSQRLHFNPSDGHIYVGEDVGFWKSYDELVKINPETGEITLVPIPFDAAALTFWYHDIAYLRTESTVMRFNSKTWKEIPWDYGVEINQVYFQTFSAPRRSTPATSGLPIPGTKPVHWQLGAMSVNAKGNLAVVCYAPTIKPKIDIDKSPYSNKNSSKEEFKLVNYQGRGMPYFINIWDKHGKLIKEDCFPGMPYTDGVGIDNDDNLFVLLGGPRYINEKDKFTEFTETLAKAIPNKAKIITASPRAEIPLPQDQIPKRKPDIIVPAFGNSWIEDAEWLYGGIGHGAQGGCACWHGSFSLDLLGRSFVPEPNQFQVGILDTNGNLIMRVGQYSNADSYGPKSPVPLGGNEIGMMMAYYVDVETDKRLFISDTGNERILSVKLNYEVDVKLPLK